MQQIHHEKCDLIHYIYPAQGRIKLYTVKRNGLIPEQHNIAQMQIAVTFADKTLRAACFKYFPASGVLGFGGNFQCRDIFSVGFVCQQGT